MQHSSNVLRIIKHVILVGDSLVQLQVLQRHLTRVNPDVAARITDICSIGKSLREKAPDMILIQVLADTDGYFQYVQAIRREPLADSTAVFVCLEPPDERTLEELLNKEGWTFGGKEQ